MIRLIRMQWRGLHGADRTGELALDEVVTLLGPNDVGKTTLLRLPSIVLDGPTQGEWPILGAVKYPFYVDLTYDTPTGPVEFSRSRGPDGQHLVQVDGSPVKVGDAKADIVARLGRAHAVSIGELLSLSGRKRLEWLTRSGVLPPVTGAEEQAALPTGAIESLLELCGDDRHAMQAYGLAGALDPDRPPFLALFSEVLATRDRENEGVIRSLVGALALYKPPGDDLPPGTPALWRDRMAEADAKIAELEHRRGEIDGQSSGRAALEVSRADVETRLGKLQTDQALDRDVATAEAALAAATAANVKAAELAQQWGARTVAAKNAAEEARTKSEPLEQRHKTLYALCEAWDSRATTAARRFAALETLDDLEQAVLHLPAATPARRIVVEIRALGKVVEIDDDGEALTATWSADAPPEPAEIAAARAEANGLRVQIGALNRQLQDATGNGRLYGQELQTANERHLHAQRAIIAAQGKLQQAVLVRDAVRQRREAALAELGRITERIEGIGDVVDHGAVLETLDAVRRQRVEMQAKHDRLSDATAAEADHVAQQEKHRIAVAHRDRIRFARKVVETAQRTALETTTRALMAPASALTSEVLGCALELDIGDADTTVYLVDRHDTRIPVETASHSQRTIAAVAFYVAVAQRIRGWRVVLIDDLEHIEVPRRDALLRALAKLVADDRLDQVVLACVDHGWTPKVGRVVRLSPRS